MKKIPPEVKPQSNPSAADIIRAAGKEWTAPYIPRNKVGEFTGGLYSAGYLANLDSLGDGPQGRFSIGRQTVYPIDSFCDWLIGKLSRGDNLKCNRRTDHPP